MTGTMVRCATQWQQPWSTCALGLENWGWARSSEVTGSCCSRCRLVAEKCFEELQLYWLAHFLKHASGALDSHAMWFAWAASSQFVPENPSESASRDQSWTVLVSPHVFSFPPGHGHTKKKLWNLRWDLRGVILCPSSMVVLERTMNWELHGVRLMGWWTDLWSHVTNHVPFPWWQSTWSVCRLTNFVVSTISALSIGWILWASLEADWARWALSTSLSVSRDMMMQHGSLFPSSLGVC